MSRVLLLMISLLWASLVFVSWEGTADSGPVTPVSTVQR